MAMSPCVVVVGGGPAGLMAASVAADAGLSVEIYDAMPSFGRKFLMAGKSGLNLTKDEDVGTLTNTYFSLEEPMRSAIRSFDAQAVTEWCQRFGVETFVGSSGRVFPKVMKASPLLRAWIADLDSKGVRFFPRHKWCGWADDYLAFETPDGPVERRADAVVFALGGGSWARLGSDGKWTSTFKAAGMPINSFRPTNCGFHVEWDDHLVERFAGEPLKTIGLRVNGNTLQGDCVLTRRGLEGGVLYLQSAAIRDGLPTVPVSIDLTPDRSEIALEKALTKPRGRNSFSNHLRKTTGLKGIKAAVLRFLTPDASKLSPPDLAHRIKDLPLPITAIYPIDEAISTAGGVSLSALNEQFMVRDRPGIFVAGEMLDWDAPTGGYLLTACFASGRAAGRGAVDWLRKSG